MDNVTFANTDTIKTSMDYVSSTKKSTSINVAFNVTPMVSAQNVLKDFIYKNSTAKETLLMAVLSNKDQIVRLVAGVIF